MKKKPVKRMLKKKTPPVSQSKGTQVLGQVHTAYVQTQFPASLAKDICNTLAQMILADYHRSFCPDDHNE